VLGGNGGSEDWDSRLGDRFAAGNGSGAAVDDVSVLDDGSEVIGAVGAVILGVVRVGSSVPDAMLGSVAEAVVVAGPVEDVDAVARVTSDGNVMANGVGALGTGAGGAEMPR
jgi:hypothetical protein